MRKHCFRKKSRLPISDISHVLKCSEHELTTPFENVCLYVQKFHGQHVSRTNEKTLKVHELSRTMKVHESLCLVPPWHKLVSIKFW